MIKASDKDIAFSISTIFLFNIVAVFLFPAAGHPPGMTDSQFGMGGTAINDVIRRCGGICLPGMPAIMPQS